MLLSLGYSNISEDSLNYRMRPIYRESDNNTVLSVRKDTGYFIDFSKQISGSFQDLVQISLKLKSDRKSVV
jgi:threonine synthase